MTVEELKQLLENVPDDAEVFFFLSQRHTNLRYEVTSVSAFQPNEDDCCPAEEAEHIYLFGEESGYAPQNATNEFL